LKYVEGDDEIAETEEGDLKVEVVDEKDIPIEDVDILKKGKLVEDTINQNDLERFA